ncbi:MAG: hypothetical protein WA705_03240 [Candidatus Ozemobacteraceae bacterium]
MQFSPEISELMYTLREKEARFDLVGKDGSPYTILRFEEVYQVDLLFPLWANYVRRESFFNKYPEMTNHAIEHIENVVSLISQIIQPLIRKPCWRPNRKAPLPNSHDLPVVNLSELFCVAAAAWLHDIGMYEARSFDPQAEDDPELVRKIHGRLSMEKIIRDRRELFPGLSPADVRVIGAIAAFHQSKAPLDPQARLDIMETFWPKKVQKFSRWKELSRQAVLDSSDKLRVFSAEPPDGRQEGEVAHFSSGVIVVAKEGTASDLWEEWLEWLANYRPEPSPGLMPLSEITRRIVPLRRLKEAPDGIFERLVDHQALEKVVAAARNTHPDPDNRDLIGDPDDTMVTLEPDGLIFVTCFGQREQIDPEKRGEVLIPLQTDHCDWGKWAEWLSSHNHCRLSCAPKAPRFVTVGYLKEASQNLWEKVKGAETVPDETEVLLLPDGKVKKLQIIKGQRSDLTDSSKFDDAWKNWVHQHLEAETIDTRFLAALVAIGDQCDVQATRSGDVGFMVRQLDRAASRRETLEKENEKIDWLIKGLDVSKPDARKGQEDLTAIRNRTALKTRLSELGKWRKIREDEIGYLKGGFEHFIRNLLIERVFIVETARRRTAARATAQTIIPGQSGLGEAGCPPVPPFADPVLSIVLRPNETRQMLATISTNVLIQQQEKLKKELEAVLNWNTQDIYHDANGYIVGELCRLQEILDERHLTMGVYAYNPVIDALARPTPGQRFRRGDLALRTAGTVLPRQFLSELQPRMDFATPTAFSGLVFQGPAGSGRRSAMLGLAHLLASTGNHAQENLIFRFTLVRSDLDSFDQISSLIHALSGFFAGVGDFGLENLLRSEPLVSRKHVEFVIEFMKKHSTHHFVLCFDELNNVDQQNRSFFQRMANELPNHRILMTTTRFPKDGWIQKLENRKLNNVRVLTFGHGDPTSFSLDKSPGLTPPRFLRVIPNGQPQSSYLVVLDDQEAAAIWKHATHELRFSPAMDAAFFALWGRFGYLPIYLHFLTTIHPRCHFNQSWLQNRLESAMSWHIEGVSAAFNHADERMMVTHLGHLVGANPKMECTSVQALGCLIEKKEEALAELTARGIVIQTGSADTPMVRVHPAWIRRPKPDQPLPPCCASPETTPKKKTKPASPPPTPTT